VWPGRQNSSAPPILVAPTRRLELTCAGPGLRHQLARERELVSDEWRLARPLMRRIIDVVKPTCLSTRWNVTVSFTAVAAVTQNDQGKPPFRRAAR